MVMKVKLPEDFYVNFKKRLKEIYGEELFEPIGVEYDLCSMSQGWMKVFNETAPSYLIQYNDSLTFQEKERLHYYIEAEIIKMIKRSNDND